MVLDLVVLLQPLVPLFVQNSKLELNKCLWDGPNYPNHWEFNINVYTIL
jgi:hypothetical protein